MFSFGGGKNKASKRLSLPAGGSSTPRPASSSADQTQLLQQQQPAFQPSLSAPGTPYGPSTAFSQQQLRRESQGFLPALERELPPVVDQGGEETAAWVPQEQYQNVLKNFRVAHAMIETQREQLRESERQVEAKTRVIAQLEGEGIGPRGAAGRGRASTDDFSIKTQASALSSAINRYAATVVASYPTLLHAMRSAVLSDNLGAPSQHPDASPLRVQSLLRHAIGEVVCSGIINVLLVTDSADANDQFTRVHDNLFARDALVASVWRRQTFSASIESFSPALQLATLFEHMPSLIQVLLMTLRPSASSPTTAREKAGPPPGQSDTPRVPPELAALLAQAWEFARVVHAGRPSSAANKEAFFRAFVPDLGSALDPVQIELVKRCHRTELGQPEVVGACLFPGLVKVSKAAAASAGGAGPGEPPPAAGEVQTVVRRAQVVCSCALLPQAAAGGEGQGGAGSGGHG